jgi:hypothetical protein
LDVGVPVNLAYNTGGQCLVQVERAADSDYRFTYSEIAGVGNYRCLDAYLVIECQYGHVAGRIAARKVRRGDSSVWKNHVYLGQVFHHMMCGDNM